jgi:hypothetical protein
MKEEIKDSSGQTLFTAEVSGNKLNIHDQNGHKLCCLVHDGKKLQLKDAQDKVITDVPQANSNK